ncbi:MAG: BON domain-containing protein [Gammaproteobacteria bacterium]|nr:BON domain-containing protein [Gammaproteobacteria bacterium]
MKQRPYARDIAAAIRDALMIDPRVIGDDIGVSVQSGIATLRGSVQSLSAKKASSQTARDTVGVLRVINELTLGDTS